MDLTPLLTPQIFGGLAVVIGFITQAYYLKGLFNGTFKPHAFSYFIYALLTGIALVAQMTGGAGSGWWVTAWTVVFCAMVFVYAVFKNGFGYVVKSDWLVFIACLAAIPLWLITKTPLYSVIFICVIDACATWPALRKAWVLPHEDSIFAWAMAGLKFLISIPALENFTLVTALYPVSIVIVNFIVAGCLWYRRRIIT